MQTNTDIQKIADQIVSVVKPERVYLFGSYAYGTPTTDSDYDFYIITSKKDDLQKVIQDARGAMLADRVMRPIDVMALDMVTFNKRKAAPTLERKIAREGIVVYERVPAGVV